MAVFELKADQFDALMSRIKAYGDGAEDIINDEFESFGIPEVKEDVQSLIHPSGRKWKGKKASAAKGSPFTHKKINLGFIVKSKSAYNYLYFPDDGTNTKRHAGRQQFMIRGAEKAAPDIMDRVIARLTDI